MLNRRNNCAGYMTVYLSLTLAVLLSLCLTMIEGARSNAIILESEIACDIALNSIMAEYNRELMKQYNIFAIEDSYGGNNASLNNTEAHLKDYLNNNFSATHFLGLFMSYRDYLGIEVDNAEVEGVLYLTDNRGEAFMRRAYEAIKDDIGLTMLEEIQEAVTNIENDGLEDNDLQNQMVLLEGQVEDAQEAAQEADEDSESDSESESSGEIVEVESDAVSNPAASIVTRFGYGTSNMFIDDVSTISSKQIDTSLLISNRIRSGYVNSGNITLEEQSTIDNLAERLVFQEYLLRYMGQYKEESDEDALAYQIEYIISGHSSDKENLDDVLSRIFAIRFSADYIYIQSDDQKKGIAEVFAELIAALTNTESLEDVYKELYLLAWASTEAIYDVKCILAGNRMNLYKSEDTWHTSMLLTEDYDEDYSGDGEGLSYTDYLRIFMTLTNKDLLVTRAMDMVEADIRLTPGNANFRMDACIDTIQVQVQVQSTFGYNYSFRLKRKYE